MFTTICFCRCLVQLEPADVVAVEAQKACRGDQITTSRFVPGERTRADGTEDNEDDQCGTVLGPSRFQVKVARVSTCQVRDE